jgi:branched-chain amino acid transport system substrate-binding protein
MMRTRTLTIVFAILSIIVIMSTFSMLGCGGEPEAVAEKWDIPLLVPVSGYSAPFGLDAEWGAERAMEEINNAGGIRGLPLKLTLYDSAFDPSKTVQVMAQALENNPLVILGPMGAIETQSCQGLVIGQGIPIFTDLSFPAMRDEFSPWGFSLYADWDEANTLAIKEWIRLNPDIKSVALVLVAGDPSLLQSCAVADREFGELGIEVKGRVEVSWGGLDAGAAAVKALSLNADGYYSVLIGVEEAMFVKALYERGMTEGERIISGGVALSSTFLEMGAGYLEDTWIWNSYDMNYQGDIWQAYVEAYKTDHDGGLPYNIAVGDYYEAVYAIKAAIENLGITGDPAKLADERLAIRDYLRNASGIPGLQGEWGYTDGLKTSHLYMFQIKNNEVELISQFR